MDESLKMLTEYVLDENIEMKREIRELKSEVEKLKQLNDRYFNSNMKQADKLAELKKEFASDLTWADGKPTGMYISTRHAIRICEILRITENDKTSV